MPNNYFQPTAIKFLKSLSANNDREWFQSRKETYERELRDPMIEVVNTINRAFDEFAPDYVCEPSKAIYRIYRDTRFSGDKTPYKTHIGASFPRKQVDRRAGGCFYFHVSPKEFLIAGGVYMPGAEELLLIRQHLVEHHERLRKLLKAKPLIKLFGELLGEELSRPPKGFSGDHAAIDLIRKKQWWMHAELEPAAACEPKMADALVTHFRTLLPVLEFLNEPLVKKAGRPRDPLLGF